MELTFERSFPINQKREVITSHSPLLSGKLLDVGCGTMPYKELILKNSKVEEYVGMDIENPIYQKEKKPDIFWDGKQIPFEAKTFQSAILIEVLEHVPDPQQTLSEIGRVLGSDGVLLLTVPFLWPLHDAPNDEFRYTPYSLERMIKKAGFATVEVNSLGGWDASLACMLSLWLTRRPFKSGVRNKLSFLLKPVISYLYRKDPFFILERKNFTEMNTGFYVIGRKT